LRSYRIVSVANVNQSKAEAAAKESSLISAAVRIKMNKITFTHNWNNKLSDKVFTTIRPHNKKKEYYYKDEIGQPFLLTLEEKKEVRPICDVKLLKVEVMKLADIPRALLFVDTGLTEINKIFNLFKRFGSGLDDKMLILTFCRYE